jgi:hypothetical protein
MVMLKYAIVSLSCLAAAAGCWRGQRSAVNAEDSYDFRSVHLSYMHNYFNEDPLDTGPSPALRFSVADGPYAERERVLRLEKRNSGWFYVEFTQTVGLNYRRVTADSGTVPQPVGDSAMASVRLTSTWQQYEACQGVRGNYPELRLEVWYEGKSVIESCGLDSGTPSVVRRALATFEWLDSHVTRPSRPRAP